MQFLVTSLDAGAEEVYTLSLEDLPVTLFYQFTAWTFRDPLCDRRRLLCRGDPRVADGYNLTPELSMAPLPFVLFYRLRLSDDLHSSSLASSHPTARWSTCDRRSFRYVVDVRNSRSPLHSSINREKGGSVLISSHTLIREIPFPTQSYSTDLRTGLRQVVETLVHLLTSCLFFIAHFLRTLLSYQWN